MGRIKKEDINKEDLEYLSLERLLTNEEIGKIFDCSLWFISDCLKYYGIKKDKSKITKKQYKNGRKVNCKIYDIPSKEDIDYMYNDRKLSLNKLSKIFSTSIPTLKKWMDEYGIKRRNISDSVKNAITTGVFIPTYSDPDFQKKIQKNRKKYNKSKAELEIVEFIKKYYKGDMFLSKYIGKYNYDIVLESLHIIIEYNGLYWHSYERNNDKNYHKKKTENANEYGYRIIHVWEDDWIFQKDRIKSWLLGILNLNNPRKIYGRKTEVKIIDNTLSLKDFFDRYHIQGYVTATMAVVLYYNDEVVSACLFRRNKDKWYLSRYVTNPEYQIIGGFPKMITHFVKKYKSDIYTFADLSWVDRYNNVYERNGFVVDKELPPDYQYIWNKRRKHKFGFRHRSLKVKLENYNPNLSESENMRNNGIMKIYDCGKLRYKYNYKDNIK